MKDKKGDVPRAGDDAYIIRSDVPELLGLRVKVISDPYEALARYIGGQVKKSMINRIEHPDFTAWLARVGRSNGEPAVLTSWLLRIPPDEEAKKLFKEESEPTIIKVRGKFHFGNFP